jgi:diguanylate cyclase (GGDEF)-like protein/PAS domain S-box-containing protein
VKTNDLQGRECLVSLQNLDIVMLRVSLAGTIHWMNDFGRGYFRWPGKETAGRSLADVLPQLHRLLPERAADIQTHPERFSDLLTDDTGPTGRRRWTAWTLRCIDEGDGPETEIMAAGRDVTAFKNTEMALCASESRLDAFFTDSPVGVVIFDDQLRFVKVNSLFARYAARRIADMTGRPLAELLPEFHREVAQGMREIITTGRPRLNIEVNAAMPGRPGERVQWLSSHFAVSLPDGRRGVGVIAMDITDRKSIEKRLRESERQEREIIDSINSIILRMNTRGEITFINKFGLEYFGYREEELLHKNTIGTIVPAKNSTGADLGVMINDLVHDPDKFMLNENENMRKGGQRVWVQWSNRSLYDDNGRLIEILASGVDITTRRQTEELLQEKEREFRTLVENSPDIIARFDRTFHLLYCNPVGERVLGIPIASVGKTLRELNGVAEIAAFFQDHLEKAFDTGREDTAEFEFPGVKGKRFYHTRIIPECDHDEKIRSVLVIGRDITERKQTEEEIRYISFHDSVTGLFNRAFCEEEIRRLDTERNLPVSLIMADVNNLKLTNDAFGHTEGDRLLTHIAETLQRCSRHGDVVSRWGGDEFVLLLPRTDGAVTRGIIERIRENLAVRRDTPIIPSVALGSATKENNGMNIYRVLREAEERMYQNKAAESDAHQDAAVTALMERLTEAGYDIHAHLSRLRRSIKAVTKALRLSQGQSRDLLQAVTLHEIGKVSIAKELLSKKTLSKEEWRHMTQHAEAGYRIARSLGFSRAAEILLAQNERWDGAGYPRQLRGGQIPFLARLFAIIDAYDVMTHDRPYGETYSTEEAVRQLEENAGRQFDPALVRMFVEKIDVLREGGVNV